MNTTSINPVRQQLQALAKTEGNLVVSKAWFGKGDQLKSVGRFHFLVAQFLSSMGIAYVTNKKMIEAKVIHYLLENQGQFEKDDLDLITQVQNKIIKSSEETETHKILELIVEDVEKAVNEVGQRTFQKGDYSKLQQFLDANSLELKKFHKMTAKWTADKPAKVAQKTLLIPQPPQSEQPLFSIEIPAGPEEEIPLTSEDEKEESDNGQGSADLDQGPPQSFDQPSNHSHEEPKVIPLPLNLNADPMGSPYTFAPLPSPRSKNRESDASNPSPGRVEESDVLKDVPEDTNTPEIPHKEIVEAAEGEEVEEILTNEEVQKTADPEPDSQSTHTLAGRVQVLPLHTSEDHAAADNHSVQALPQDDFAAQQFAKAAEVSRSENSKKLKQKRSGFSVKRIAYGIGAVALAVLVASQGGWTAQPIVTAPTIPPTDPTTPTTASNYSPNNQVPYGSPVAPPSLPSIHSDVTPETPPTTAPNPNQNIPGTTSISGPSTRVKTPEMDQQFCPAINPTDDLLNSSATMNPLVNSAANLQPENLVITKGPLTSPADLPCTNEIYGPPNLLLRAFNNLTNSVTTIIEGSDPKPGSFSKSVATIVTGVTVLAVAGVAAIVNLVNRRKANRAKEWAESFTNGQLKIEESKNGGPDVVLARAAAPAHVEALDPEAAAINVFYGDNFDNMEECFEQIGVSNKRFTKSFINALHIDIQFEILRTVQRNSKEGTPQETKDRYKWCEAAKNHLQSLQADLQLEDEVYAWVDQVTGLHHFNRAIDWLNKKSQEFETDWFQTIERCKRNLTFRGESIQTALANHLDNLLEEPLFWAVTALTDSLDKILQHPKFAILNEQNKMRNWDKGRVADWMDEFVKTLFMNLSEELAVQLIRSRKMQKNKFFMEQLRDNCPAVFIKLFKSFNEDPAPLLLEARGQPFDPARISLGDLLDATNQQFNKRQLVEWLIHQGPLDNFSRDYRSYLDDALEDETLRAPVEALIKDPKFRELWFFGIAPEDFPKLPQLRQKFIDEVTGGGKLDRDALVRWSRERFSGHLGEAYVYRYFTEEIKNPNLLKDLTKNLADPWKNRILHDRTFWEMVAQGIGPQAVQGHPNEGEIVEKIRNDNFHKLVEWSNKRKSSIQSLYQDFIISEKSLTAGITKGWQDHISRDLAFWKEIAVKLGLETVTGHPNIKAITKHFKKQKKLLFEPSPGAVKGGTLSTALVPFDEKKDD